MASPGSEWKELVRVLGNVIEERKKVKRENQKKGKPGEERNKSSWSMSRKDERGRTKS